MKLDVSLEEAFDLGHREGLKEAFQEILEMSKTGSQIAYLKARLKTLNDGMKKNPFKKDQTK